MSKIEKIANIVKKMLKLVMLMSYLTFHYIWKLYSNLFSNPRGDSLALSIEKPRKRQKLSQNCRKKAGFIKKLLKFVTLKG